ncbi:hypothetical protein ACJX0J_009155, partial [Zea mays]
KRIKDMFQQVIWKCLYMTGGMKHVWLISDDEDLDDEVDDGQHQNTVPTPRHWSQKWKFLQFNYGRFIFTLHILSLPKWLGSKTLVTTTSSINPFSQIKNIFLWL